MSKAGLLQSTRRGYFTITPRGVEVLAARPARVHNRKKRTYFATRDGVSPFALTTQVLQEKSWTPEVVERRQKKLVERLKELWRL